MLNTVDISALLCAMHHETGGLKSEAEKRTVKKFDDARIMISTELHQVKLASSDSTFNSTNGNILMDSRYLQTALFIGE